MELGDRKRKILQSIIEDYIQTAEPVGSRTIAKRTDLGLSSATIRNEMADLEEMGYLISPHTSAGRVPSDNAYRFYVNELMREYSQQTQAIVSLQRVFTAGVLQLDRLIKLTGDLISRMTSYTTVAITPELNQSYVKKFELVSVDDKSTLLVLIISNDVVKSRMLDIGLTEDYRQNLSHLLNEKLAGLTLEEINLVRINEIQMLLGDECSALMPILSFVHQTISELNGSEIYVANTKNILQHPEYSDASKAMDIISFLEDKQSVKNAVDAAMGDKEISVVIGEENTIDKIKDTSIITTKYMLGDKLIGKIGIVGPKRMDYAKVITSLKYIEEHLDSVIDELYKSERGDSADE